MSYQELIKKIKKWRELAQDYEDYFIKFALEYFVFNALLRIVFFPDKEAIKDKTLIDKLKEDDECKDFVLKGKESWIKKLKTELERKPLSNPTRNNTLTLENLTDWGNLVEAVYWIRNNLFHGYKCPGDERDQKLVKYGYNLLCGFDDYLLGRTD